MRTFFEMFELLTTLELYYKLGGDGKKSIPHPTLEGFYLHPNGIVSPDLPEGDEQMPMFDPKDIHEGIGNYMAGLATAGALVAPGMADAAPPQKYYTAIDRTAQTGKSPQEALWLNKQQFQDQFQGTLQLRGKLDANGGFVTVVMPVYNPKNFNREVHESIVAQLLHNKMITSPRQVSTRPMGRPTWFYLKGSQDQYGISVPAMITIDLKRK
jgi:hypothetical protein